jgi:DeoD family purine-nucleoside phosphorylase
VTATIHLQPTAALADRVLLPGDPGRALRLAQALLEEPKMFNHNRGLWGYSGAAKLDGQLLSIQSTGMGGPSAAIVASELIDLGAQRLLRVGTCGALDPALSLGDLVVVTEALAADGTSRALGSPERVAADGVLLRALGLARESLSENRAHDGAVVSSDLFYDRREREPEWARVALAVEMECAAVFALAAQRAVRAAAVLAVSDLLIPERRRIDEESLHAAELRLGALAATALHGQSPSSPSQ